MSKERLEEANEWLKSMYEILSTKTEVEDIEYLQKRIDLFEWMRLEIYSLYGGETFEGYIEQNKHYREAFGAIEDLYNQLNDNAEIVDGIMMVVRKTVKALEE